MRLWALNLYAGIGGNRKNWPDDVAVTAIEIDPEIAAIYHDNFPNDRLIVSDAHEFLVREYQNFDFIWSSPPCPTHSRLMPWQVSMEQKDAAYPDMRLYQEIIFLQTFYAGRWVVENVVSYYSPLIIPQVRGRHVYWSNFHIPESVGKREVIERATIEMLEKLYGFDLSTYNLGNNRKRQVLRNCVHPQTGRAIWDAAQQARLL